MASVGINYEDRARNFGHFPELQLFQMASNGSTRLEYRRYAVELLLEKGYKSADKPELAALRAEVLKARADAGDPIVPEKASDDRENAAAARLLRLDESLADGQVLNNAAQAEYGALKASVTTASLSQEPIDDRTDFPPVQKMDEPSVAQDSVAQDSATRAPEVEPRIEAASQEAATPSTSE